MVRPRDIEQSFTEGDFPPCLYCKHLTRIGSQKSLQGWRCKAFPNGIGYGILARLEDHTKALPYDNGLRYESRTYKTASGKRHRIRWNGEWEYEKS